jgi:type IV pilus assembly protein PilW
MRRRQIGFGLLEVVMALAIGLLLLAAASQLFTSAHQAAPAKHGSAYAG